jgi:hypothetical protein
MAGNALAEIGLGGALDCVVLLRLRLRLKSIRLVGQIQDQDRRKCD